MRPFSVQSARSICGRLTLPGDKSIAHRAVIISSLANGTTTISNFPANEDCLYTLRAFQKLGARITSYLKAKNKYLKVYGKGPGALKKPRSPLFAGDSGTTLRLTLGVLAGCNFKVKLTSAKSLAKRPMLRVTAPLRMMGAKISARQLSAPPEEEYPPITIEGRHDLKPINYKMPVASAQVKSAILLAGLRAQGTTRITEPLATRDHTERMLKLFGAEIKTQGRVIAIRAKKQLSSPGALYIPADISSASFFMVLAAILAHSKIIIEKVSLNPSRLGIIKVLKRMGADIKIDRCRLKAAGLEPLGDITVRSSSLRSIRVTVKEVPFLIDELPILMVAVCFAPGKSVFEGAGELRVKETDRINSICLNLKRMGADIEIMKSSGGEKIVIRGGRSLKGCRIRSFGDHRTAMSMVIAGLAARGRSILDDADCINKSFPEFLPILKSLLS